MNGKLSHALGSHLRSAAMRSSRNAAAKGAAKRIGDKALINDRARQRIKRRGK